MFHVRRVVFRFFSFCVTFCFPLFRLLRYPFSFFKKREKGHGESGRLGVGCDAGGLRPTGRYIDNDRDLGARSAALGETTGRKVDFEIRVA